MDGEHYFSARPASDERRQSLLVTLQGEPFELQTAGGTFSPERLDAGTAALLNRVPPPASSGALLDLGCGWGPIAITMARRSPEAEVWAVDVNERALALTAENARIAGVQIRTSSPEGIPAALRFATIWSNPPVRIGKAALHELLEAWLPRLAAGGSAWLVIAKHLGGDSLQSWLHERFPEFEVRRAATDRGYRVLTCRRR